MADNETQGDGHGPTATVLLTRPRAQSEAFAARIRARLPEADIRLNPLMEIVPSGPPPELRDGDAIIFTSANGVAAAGQGQGRAAWCVGERTCAAARAAGFSATVAGETADALVAHLAELRPAGRLVHLHGAHTRGDVAARLAGAGLSTVSRTVYDQVAVTPGPDLRAALGARRLIAPLFSPRSATLLASAAADLCPAFPGPEQTLLALSPAVRDALPMGWRAAAFVVQRPDATAMLDGIVRQVYP
jgi:uroporphyrinogen-III synthase